jgi:hypothetical protein
MRFPAPGNYIVAMASRFAHSEMKIGSNPATLRLHATEDRIRDALPKTVPHSAADFDGNF